MADRKDPRTELRELLEACGAELIRSKRHNVFKLPSGRRFTVPKTASDTRSLKNSLARLKRLLRQDEEQADG